ncbi:Sigma-70, region 4 [Halorientalis persicus]|uniref:Sigma-70, region 4 n=1 Tax=Halorientalis persicus TaxID=1367881 RepID=A0A1H8PDM6_9EURY|nr:sigma factor-like helix-turn-helix DNA-binding protein [Halorientalis persicus]SEO40109.1 Sigma-70, region 4 [Halorientalis persicus]
MSAIQDLPTYDITDRNDYPPIIHPRDGRDLADSEEPEPTFIYIGEYAGKAAYFNPLRQSIMLGEVHGAAFTEDAYLEAPKAESLEDHIRNLIDTAQEENVEFALSKQALGLLYGDLLARGEWLPEKQAKVYLLRRVFDIERQRTATVLGISPSTVDSHLRSVTPKVEAARNLTEALHDLEDLVKD